ncbi:MAG: hypothetical protein Q7S02_01970 [bacterium]|nr:hypothetical protein [bacterium]
MTVIALPTLGVDIGGVIIDRSGHAAADDPTSSAYLDIPVVRHAFLALAFLNRKTRFRNRIHLISRRRNRNDEAGDRAWLAHRGFHEHTGIPTSHVHFCEERDEKALICARLGVTHAIDDRLEIIVALDGIVPHRILFHPDREEIDRTGVPLIGIHIAERWNDALAIIRSTTPAFAPHR